MVCANGFHSLLDKTYATARMHPIPLNRHDEETPSGLRSGCVRSTTTLVMSSLRPGICVSQRRAQTETISWQARAGVSPVASCPTSSFSMTSQTPSVASTMIRSLSSSWRVAISGIEIRYG